eukprot:Em0017g788a
MEAVQGLRKASISLQECRHCLKFGFQLEKLLSNAHVPDSDEFLGSGTIGAAHSADTCNTSGFQFQDLFSTEVVQELQPEERRHKEQMAALANDVTDRGNPLQSENEDWLQQLRLPEASERSYTPTNDRETNETTDMSMRMEISRQVQEQLQGATVEFRTEFQTLKEQVSRILAQQAVQLQQQPLPGRGGGAQHMVDKIAELERLVAMLKVRVAELELQLQASLATTRTGVFLWRIPNVAERRRDAKGKRICSIYSPPFYTGPNGYKLCVRAYLNGDGLGCGSHLSVFIVVMRGEYDALLPWPFRAKVSLVLLDQGHRKHITQTFKPTPDLPSFRRPHSEMNVATGCPQFAPLDVLDDTRYVNDDVMFIKCIVDVSSLFVP